MIVFFFLIFFNNDSSLQQRVLTTKPLIGPYLPDLFLFIKWRLQPVKILRMATKWKWNSSDSGVLADEWDFRDKLVSRLLISGTVIEVHWSNDEVDGTDFCNVLTPLIHG